MPDDKQIISVSDIGSMYLWQWQTGEITKRYHPNIGLRQVDICADGKKALVGTIDSQLILIDLQTSDIIMRLKGHAGRVDTVYLGEHANTAFSGASDGELRLWDLNNGAIADHIQISGEVGYIASFDLSVDGRTGLFGFMSGKMALWSRGTNEFLHRWQGHNDMLSGGVAFSLDGNLAVSGSGDFFGKPIDNAICVWDLRRGERLFQFHGHTSHVRGVAFAPNQQFVLSAGFDGTVRYGSLVDGSERILLNVSPQGVLSVAILPDGNRAIIGLGQGRHLAPDTDVIMLDIETGDIIRRFQGHSEGVMGLAIALDGSFFLSGGFDNTVRMWDVET
ncbi:MAG: WD40 repeat domain-containing protein, partial [Methylococcales bacterium]|nr:WD40 repeat domain-containing protein [Methylococcales bacterium]